jgi:hypothetical protein
MHGGERRMRLLANAERSEDTLEQLLNKANARESKTSACEAKPSISINRLGRPSSTTSIPIASVIGKPTANKLSAGAARRVNLNGPEALYSPSNSLHACGRLDC